MRFVPESSYGRRTRPAADRLPPVPTGGERPRWDQRMARTNDTERPMADGRERNPSPNFLVRPPQPRVGPLRWHIVAQTRPIHDKRRTRAGRGEAEDCAASLQFRSSDSQPRNWTRDEPVSLYPGHWLCSLPSALCPLPSPAEFSTHRSLLLTRSPPPFRLAPHPALGRTCQCSRRRAGIHVFRFSN